jgi:hypothetical protein
MIGGLMVGRLPGAPGVCLELPRRYNVFVAASARPPELNSPSPGTALLKSRGLGLEAIGLRIVEVIILIIPAGRCWHNFAWGSR